jgi:hypothetical protein
MREVAEHERETSLTELREAVERQVAAIQERIAEEADELRRRSELDVAGIADWVREESDRIRVEAERKVEARQQQLSLQLTAHDHQGEREVDSLRTRLSEYEKELAGFFKRLEAINDPAAFGAAAKQMPRPPAIGQKATPPTSTPAPTNVAEPASPVEPEPVAEPEAVAEPAAVAEPKAEVASELEAALAPDSATEPEATAAPDAPTELEATEAEAEPAAQAAPETAAEPVAEAVAEPKAESAAESQQEPELKDDAAAAADDTPEPGAEVVTENEHTLRLAALGIEHADGGGEPEGTEAGAAQAATAPGGAPSPSTAASESATGVATARSSDKRKDAERLEARLAELDATIGADSNEAAPATQVPAQASEAATAVIVKGLGSFGAITSFKQALERVEGVRGISLSLGPTGEFVYRATHDEAFDLAAAIETIEHGNAQVERIADGSLRVTVSRGR